MSTATAKKAKNRLSDGRAIRALDGTFKQEQMFGLHKSGHFSPATERIMGIKEHDDSLNVSNVWKTIDVNRYWRTDRYVAYRRGFEKEDIPIGEKLIYDDGGGDARTFEIPDVPVTIIGPDGKSEIIGLRTAIGMLDFDLAKLRYDPETRIVSVDSSFNADTDVHVVNIMRPNGWALVDEIGYPLRSKPSDVCNANARYSCVRDAKELQGESTGYHGSVFIGSAGSIGNKILWNGMREVKADVWWFCLSGVAVVGREAVTPDLEIINFGSVESNDGPYRTTPARSLIHSQGTVIEAAEREYERLSQDQKTEQITAIRRLLNWLRIKD